jgi:hypothetical protein
MAFDSGRVTFCRFHTVGNAPKTADEALLEALAEHAFVDGEGAGEEVTSGFVAGAHLFDAQFEYAKNCFGDAVLLGLRIETNRVPADVRRAYRVMHEQAMAEANPSGFLSRRQKREAAESADRQVHDELASGRHKRSKLVPLLWDLKRKQLFCAALGSGVAEQLSAGMHRAFGLSLEPLTAGALAGRLMRKAGTGRDYEDLLPSPFTAPPPQARTDADDAANADGPRDVKIPSVPWAFRGVDAKDFLGNEMLIWLWWLTETAEGTIEVGTDTGKVELAVVIDRLLEMDCAWGAAGKQSLRGEAGLGPTRLPEAAAALRHGKWPRKLGLMLADGVDQRQWELTLQGDAWTVSAATLPTNEDAESVRETIEQRIASVRDLAELLDGLFSRFLRERVGGQWKAQRERIAAWIASRRR